MEILPVAGRCIQTSCDASKIHTIPMSIPEFNRRHDLAMKFREPSPAFVDGLYAKFYSLFIELLRVGPKGSSSSARLDSFPSCRSSRGETKSIRYPSSEC